MTLEDVKNEIMRVPTDIDTVEYCNRVSEIIGRNHPFRHNPVSCVKYVPLNKVKANDYNPNAVASPEMRLLHKSIQEDGYTMPVVTFYDKDSDEYVIVDGFHRYSICQRYRDVNSLNHGYLPVVVIDKPLGDRMASTVRHNRARGRHSVQGMSNLVLEMLREGKSDADVCMELGLEIDELIKLKHVTGFAKLFEGAKYSHAWESNNQIMSRVKEQEKEDEEQKME